MPDTPKDQIPGPGTSPATLSVAFIGCGAVGRCLGRLMRENGFSIEGVCCTRMESASEACRFIGGGTPVTVVEEAAASARMVIIATPDRAINEVAQKSSPGVKPGSIVIHLSGALSSELLEPCRSQGAAVASMHPLQSFADPEAALRIVPGSVFACEGDETAVTTAFEIARRVGGKPIRIETASKSIYHAAAAAASNFMIAPLLLALDLMKAAGIERRTGLTALTPLILGTAQNATSVGIPDALTGPIERGDQVVIKGHLDAIKSVCPQLEGNYLTLARMTVEAARRKGALSDGAARDMLKILR